MKLPRDINRTERKASRGKLLKLTGKQDPVLVLAVKVVSTNNDEERFWENSAAGPGLEETYF